MCCGNIETHRYKSTSLCAEHGSVRAPCVKSVVLWRNYDFNFVFSKHKLLWRVFLSMNNNCSYFFMSLLRIRHFNSRLLETLKVIACSWVLKTFPFVTALYELILIDIQLSSYACLFVGGTICLLLGLGNAISTEVSRTECVYYIYAYEDPIPWWNDTAAYTRTSCLFKASFRKIREKVPQIDFSVLKRKTRMVVWINKFSAFYQGVSWTGI